MTTLMVAAQRCLHTFFEPWRFWTRAILVAHVVMEALLVAHHDLRHLLAILVQFLPISLALVPAICARSTFHGTGDGLLGSWLRLWQCWQPWNHRRDWINHWLCAMVVEVSIMVVMEVSIVVLVVEVTILVLVVEATIVVMMEVTIMVMVEVTMVAKAMLSEELPQTSLGAVTMATEVVAFLMAALTFHECLAFHEDLLHWFGAHVMAFTVSAALSVAFHGFLNMCLHMRAAGQRTLLMALMIMTTGLMTFHDRNSLITSCLEVHPEWLWTLFLTMHIITTLCMATSELGHNELCRRGLEVFNPFVEAMRDVPLCETAASFDKHLHWTIANLAAATIGTALLVALDDASWLGKQLEGATSFKGFGQSPLGENGWTLKFKQGPLKSCHSKSDTALGVQI